MNIRYKPGDIVQRSDMTLCSNVADHLAMLISENEFHPGYWKVLFHGEVAEWFMGNFKAIPKSNKTKIKSLVKL